jgi:signal transduction histidine kinase/ActR/RegA family two-component response regulator
MEKFLVPEERIQNNFKFLTGVLSIIVFLVPVSALIGYGINNQFLKSINPNWSAMRVNTAFCFIMCSFSLFCLLGQSDQSNHSWKARLGKIFAMLAGLIGVLTLVEFLIGKSLGVDTFFYAQNFTKPLAGTLPEGRMAANTSVNFLLASIALFLLHSKNNSAAKIAQWIAILIILITLPPLVGYFYGAKFLEGLVYLTQMAVQTAICFIMLACAIAFSKVKIGIMSIFSRQDAGGVSARRLIPLVIGIPFAVDFIVLLGSSLNLYEASYAMALSAVLSMLFIGLVVYHNAHVISKMEKALLLSHMDLEKKVEGRTAELINAREGALAAATAKSHFLSNMSHEMRTPMNALLGMTEMLAETNLDEEQQQFLGILTRAGDNLLVLINDILDFSKIESSDMKLEVIEFDLREVVESSVELLTAKAITKGLKLTVDLKPGVATSLTGDPHRLRQILINLISNAVKFTPKGEVILRIEKDPANQMMGALKFSVIDTGIGIPNTIIGSLFERFTQADASVTRKYGGTGLGLSISRKLVELMNGNLSVQSVEGKGSCFTFSLVFGIHQNTLAPKTVMHNLDTRFLNILLVDDSEDNRNLILQYLKKTNYSIVTAGNGEEAVELFKASRFDLILMDMQMPLMDGYTATKIIRYYEHEKSMNPTPIVALTAFAFSEDEGKSLAAGCNRHMTKPVRKQSLLDTIVELTTRPHPMQE